MPPKQTTSSSNPEPSTQALNDLMQLVRSLSDRMASMEALAASDRQAAITARQAEPAPSPTVSQENSTGSFSTMDNRIKVALPEKFDGSASNYDTFVQSLDNFFALKSSVYSTDEIRVRTVGTLLTKSALSWFSTIVKTKSPLLSNYSAFLEELQRLFSDPNLKENAQQKIRNLRQGSGSALVYASKFRTLAIDTGFNNDALMASFKNGLKEELKDIMAKSTEPPPKTLEELIAAATRLDNRIFERKKETVDNFPKRQYSTGIVSSASPRFKKLSAAEKQYRIKNNLCLYCGGNGHSHSNCPKKKKSPGSPTAPSGTISSVSSGISSASTASENYENPVESPSTSLAAVIDHRSFMAEISLLVQGKEVIVDALIDSGASANFLDSSLIHEYNLNTSLASKNLSLADGSPLSTISQIKNIEVFTLSKDGSFSATSTDFLVSKLQFKCILGLPWMTQARPVINWDNLTISFNNQFSIAAVKDSIPKDYQNFAEVFNPNKAVSLPPLRSCDMEINLKDESKQPKRQPIYSLSLKEQNYLKEWIKENLDQGLIRPSKSEYGAPIFFVPKSDGGLRPCIDYRDLNQNTKLDVHPLPLISQLMDQLGHSKIFTKLDLRGAYNLVRIKDGDQYKAAFRCKDGHFEPLVIQFGLTNAPAVFQRFMNSIFQDILDEYVIIYLDDILIYSKNINDHKQHVKEVLNRLKKHDLTAKLEKCLFHTNKLAFLGYIITDEGISMDPKKTSAISNFPTPTNVSQLRSFLGLCNFYRGFISNYSYIAKPLTDLTGKTAFLWTTEVEAAFNQLKTKLTNQVMLPYPDQLKQFYLSTDASDHSLGGVLSQKDEDQNLRPVAFFSRKLNDAERNYSVYDKELLAIVDCLKFWRHYLVSPVEPTRILTDHKNLLFFKTPHLLKPRHARWAELLSQFPFVLDHIPGSLNRVADALSRANSNLTPSPSKIQPLTLLPNEKWTVGAITNESEWPEVIYYFLQNDQWPDGLSEAKLELVNSELKHFKLKDNLLYYQMGLLDKLYVPQEERSVILQRYHESLGHLASKSIIDLIERHYWWPNLEKDLKTYIANCSKCQLNKPLPANVKKQLQTPVRPIPPVGIPFERWGLDFVQNLPLTESGNKHIITAIDYATRWPVAKAVPKMDTETVLSFLYELVMNYGTPLEIITDRGKSLLAEAVDEYEKRNLIKHHASTPYHPQTNGMVERMHSMLGHAITCLVDGIPKRWDEFLAQTLFSMRVRTHSTTGYSPFYLLYGIDPRLPFDPRPPPETMRPLDEEEYDEFCAEYTARELDILGEHRAAAYHRSLQQASKMKNKTNDDNVDDYHFDIGDMVKLKHHGKTKFEFKWKGPYYILRRGHPGTYFLISPRGDVWNSSVNQFDLAPWLSRTEDNVTFFYDGTSREWDSDSDIIASLNFTALWDFSTNLTPPLAPSLSSGLLEGDSVTITGLSKC
jgi:hypothetical protein